MFGREKELERAFLDGDAEGYERGVVDGLAKKFDHTKEINEEEHKEVIEFLVSRNLECCYDVFRGGFRIRKRIYN